MTTLQCPVCDSQSDGGESFGDSILFICPRCGGYRIAETVLTLLRNGTLPRPDPDHFRELIKRKRGNSKEYPTITSYDLGPTSSS